VSMSSDSAAPPTQPLDGPTLRAVRESIGVPLRKIARTAGMSHGHLSKVERGEHGRPVTPAIMSAYERVTGVKLAEAAAGVTERRNRETGRGGKTWTPGQLTELRRQGYNAAIGALAIGGHLGEPMSRLIDATGRPLTPEQPDQLEIAQLEQLAGLLTALDMRYGGALVAQLAKALLRWAAPMLHTSGMDPEHDRRLHATVGVIAHRAGWAAYDIQAHEAARSLFRFALHTATLGAEHDLRGHVLADIAAQHNQLGYRRDALDIIRLAEGDERIAPAVRVVLHGVKARTYGCLGDSDACLRQIGAAEDAFSQASPGQPDWVANLANPARLYAITGHAMADLAEHGGDQPHRKQAIQRLNQAVDQFDTTVHARAHALCLTRLATLLVLNGDLAGGEQPKWMNQRLPQGVSLRSGRLGPMDQAWQAEEPVIGNQAK